MKQQKTNENVESNSDSIYALGLHEDISWILGIWPLSCHDVFSKIRFMTVVILQMTMLFSLIAEIFIQSSSMNAVAIQMTLVGASILSLVKIVLLRCRFRRKIREIIASAMEDWSRIMNPRARGIMRENAKIGRYVFVFQMTSGYSSVILLIIGALLPVLVMPQVNVTLTLNESAPITDKLRGLPLTTVCLFGDMSDFLYIVIFSLQALQLFITVTGNIGNDVFFFTITMHLSAQLELLGEDLESLGVNVNPDNEYNELVELVKRHVKLSQLAQNIEDSFNFIILLQLSANTSQMCTMGIQMILSLKSGDVVMFINGVVILIILNLQLFLYCYAGDCLSSQISNLGVSAYFSSWYDMPQRLAKDVPFIIMRNNKRFNVTAGKVYRIDIDNFKNVLKALVSYFSVLRLMFDA